MKKTTDVKTIILTDIETGKTVTGKVDFMENGVKVSDRIEETANNIFNDLTEKGFRFGDTLRVEMPEAHYVAEYQLKKDELLEQLIYDLKFC